MSLENEKITISFLGSPLVGKTSLIENFKGNNFTEEYIPTTEEEIINIDFKYEDKIIDLNIIDNPGINELTSELDNSISETDIFVLVYSMISLDTFEFLQKLLNSIINKKKKYVEILIFGNKKDILDQNTFSNIDVAKVSNYNIIKSTAKDQEYLKKELNNLIIKFLDKKKKISEKKIKKSKDNKEEKNYYCCF